MTDLVDVVAELAHDLREAVLDTQSLANHLLDRQHDEAADVAACLAGWEALLICARDLKDVADDIYRMVGGVLARHYRSEGAKPRDQWDAAGRTFTLTAGSARKQVDHEALAAALIDFVDENGLGPVMTATTILSVVPLTRSTAVRTAALKELGLEPGHYIEWSDRGPARVTVAAAPLMDLREGDIR